MCGICGIIRLDGGEVNPHDLDRLTDALAHRGPDGRGTFVDHDVGLGHRRLKILDLSEAAGQPMRSPDGSVVLTFNGELYNYRDIRTMLEQRGHRFTSTGDTEVLLHLYMEEGERCVDRLRGMFAFAVYDRTKQCVFLARDRLGKKPLKYFCDGRTFAFASELKALRVLSSCPRAIDAEAVHHFLTMMYIPAPGTGFSEIKKLPAATTLIIDLSSGKVHEPKRYWELRYQPDPSPSCAEWKEKIIHTLDESVRLRMVADVPVGAFLSGGVDSAAVVAFMARHSPHPVQTFSIGSPEETHNELPFAALTAKAFGADHHPIVLTPDIVHLLPELVHAYEEPYADPSSIPTYLVARETRKHVTVALNGDGGDENFLGYQRYPILRFSLLYGKMPSFFHSGMLGLVRSFHALHNSTLSYRALRFQSTIRLPWPQRSLQYLSFFTEEEKSRLYTADSAHRFPRTDVWHADRTQSARLRSADPVEQSASADIDTYLADDLLPKVDLGCMAHGLEARSPLLDHTLLELSARIPSRYKLRGLKTKWIFKESLKGTVPDAVLGRRKTGFRLPLDRWFRSDLRAFVSDRLLDPRSPLTCIMETAALEEFLDRYFSSHIDYSDHIWALLWLDEWLRQYS
jgi:asparagine synthase (glutamine-hydrolysing)